MLDESNTTTKDTLLEKGQSSSGEEGGTSTVKPRNYTEKELSDRVAKAGREKVSAMETQIEELKDQIESLKTDPSKPVNAEVLAGYRKQVRDLKAANAQKEQENADLREQASKGTKYEQLDAARKLAEPYENIDPEDLIGKDEEGIKAFLKKYGKKKGETTPEGESYKPDSGVTHGGKVTLTNDNVEKMDVSTLQEELSGAKKK
jgi:hypothetical protein